MTDADLNTLELRTLFQPDADLRAGVVALVAEVKRLRLRLDLLLGVEKELAGQFAERAARQT